MKIFITDEQKAELEHLHDTTRDGRVRDRIKAVLLASEGWTSAMIAQALRLHETTVNQHINDYVNTRKLKPENGGSNSMLSATQTANLISQLSLHLFHHTRDIVAYVEQRWAIRFSIPGMNKWLHRQGFTYKKPAGIPHKFSEQKQKQFIEYYENLKKTAGNEPILFIDAVHPTQATKLSYGWIRKGHKKSVKTTGSRTRLNILGALNLSDIGNTVIHDDKTINDYNIARFFIEIRKRYPDYRQKIHVILDGAGYHRTQLIKDWAFVVNIELHYLPPYSPNLNAIFSFFSTTLPEIADSLTSRIHDRFQVLKPAS